MVRKMAVQHPVAWIYGIKLDIACLSNTNNYSVTRKPGGLWYPSALCASNVELLSMNMNWMVIHTHVYHSYPYPFSQLYNHRSCRWSSFAIYRQPVELHRHCIRYSVVRQESPFLQDETEIFMHCRLVWFLWMDNEQSDHPHHLLHRSVRVIEECSILVKSELINEPLTRLDERLADIGRSIHLDRNFKAMPVDCCILG